jgi:hypothetical protein
MRKLVPLFLAVLAIFAAVACYSVVRGFVTQEVYRHRLRELGQEYEQLRAMYNSAIRRTAVTELSVRNGKLTVLVTSAAGTLRSIPTDFDPSSEIHVDYVVIDGRLWIRRIHDSKTPPSQALLIDPKLADVEWDDHGKVYGTTIYRPLGEGRWIVSVTSNGALTLAKKTDDSATRLAPPPHVREFAELESSLAADLDEIGPISISRALLSRWFGD